LVIYWGQSNLVSQPILLYLGMKKELRY